MDADAGRDVLQNAAEHGELDAMKRLAETLASEGEFEQAERWSNRVAETGDAEAMILSAYICAQRSNLSGAIVWLRRAAELGSTEAMYELSYGLRDQDPVESEVWARKAAGAGNHDAMHGLGTLLRMKGDTEGAEEWYRDAAEAGHIYAMNSLGDLLVALGRKAEAETWYHRSADAGSSHGMEWMGMLAEEKGAQDEAWHWFQKAESAGDARGSCHLGVLLHERGDRDEALIKLHQAADGGVADAMTYLGFVADDRGDIDDAARWYARAIEAGSTDARGRLDELKDRADSARLLDIVQFETFGWNLVFDGHHDRLWRSEGASLREIYLDQPPDLPSWDAQKIREAFDHTQEFLSSSDFDPEEIPEWVRERMPGAEIPDEVRLVDLELFEAPPAKCVLMINRHRSHGSVHYAGGALILFAECYWALMLELEESADIGAREGAVAGAYLGLPPQDVVDATIDPYDRKWDGIVPLEDDPLTRLRILTARLRNSITLGDAAADLTPFSAEE